MKEENSKAYIRTKDFLVSGESFSLLKDESLAMLKTHPQPKSSELGAYYDSKDYISHTDAKKGLISFLYQTVKKRSLRKKVKLISRLNGGTGSLLDIGAGTGEFCVVASKSKWQVTAIEPNQTARNITIEKGLDVYPDMNALSGKTFDVVTLWHVLEHLPNLEKSVAQIKQFVNPGGVLIVAVPNYNSYDALYYKSYWAAYDVPRHLWHFSKTSMPLLFGDAFQSLKTVPMIFDSFYVSLLSEKYKSGNAFSVRAFFVGLWSNLSAWRTKEYSSLIYCFKKFN